jgi:hypothetical protein
MGGGSNEATSVQSDVTPPEYRQLRERYGSAFQDVASQYGDITGGYQGPTTADITPEEQGLVDQIATWGGGQPTPNQQAAMDARLATIRGENLGTTNLQPLFSQINEAFDEGTLQNAGMFTSAGHAVQDSSPFARSEAIREKARIDAIGKVATDVHMGERGLQEAAAAGEEGQAAARQGIDAAEVQALVDRLQATQLPRLIADMGIERGMAQFNSDIQNLLAMFGMGVQASMPQLATSSKSGGWNMFI